MRIDVTTGMFDVTLPFSPEIPVWPGDLAIEVVPVDRTAEGAAFNTSRIVCPTHCGTHVDPPRHAVHDGDSLSDLPLERWIGPCQLIEFDDTIDLIEPEHLERAGIAPETSRLLFRTRNSAGWRRRPLSFDPNYVALSLAAARWIERHGIRLIGVDGLSFEPYESDDSVHRFVLGNGIVAIEGLNLSDVPPGFYDLICLPLKLVGGDGAPARVILLDNGRN